MFLSVSGDNDTEVTTTDNEEMRDDKKHDDLDTEDTESAYGRNETTPPKKRGVGFNMNVNTSADPKDMTESDTDIGAPDPQQMLALQYDDTTLNEDSTDPDEEEEADATHNPKPTHGSLFRDQSNWKWQHSEVVAEERAQEEMLQKLKAQHEEAEIRSAITFHRQQSTGDLQV